MVLHPGHKTGGTAVAMPVAVDAAHAAHAALPRRLPVICPGPSLRNKARRKQRRAPTATSTTALRPARTSTTALWGRGGCRKRAWRSRLWVWWRVVVARGERWRECLGCRRLRPWLRRRLLLHARGLLYASQPRERFCVACALGIEPDASPPSTLPAASVSSSHELGNEQESPTIAPPTIAPASSGASTAHRGGSLGAPRGRGRAVCGARQERGRHDFARGTW